MSSAGSGRTPPTYIPLPSSDTAIARNNPDFKSWLPEVAPLFPLSHERDPDETTSIRLTVYPDWRFATARTQLVNEPARVIRRLDNCLRFAHARTDPTEHHITKILEQTVTTRSTTRIRVPLEGRGWESAQRYRLLYLRRVRERFRRRGLIPPVVAILTTDDAGRPDGMVVYVCEDFTLWTRSFLEAFLLPDDWITIEALPLLSDLFSDVRALYPDIAQTPPNVGAVELIRGAPRRFESIEVRDLAVATKIVRRRLARHESLRVTNHVTDGPYPRADYIFEHRHRPKARHRLRGAPE